MQLTGVHLLRGDSCRRRCRRLLLLLLLSLPLHRLRLPPLLRLAGRGLVKLHLNLLELHLVLLLLDELSLSRTMRLELVVQQQLLLRQLLLGQSLLLR